MLTYLTLSILIILCILVIISLIYAGSYNPYNLFSKDNQVFSFSGDPLSASVTSYNESYLYADMIDNGSVFAYGGSIIHVYPDSPITLVSDTGEKSTLSGPITIQTLNGTAGATVSFLKGDASYYNNTHIYFNNATLLFDHRGSNYNLVMSSNPGSYTSYDDEFNAADGTPLYSFDHYIHLKDGDFVISQAGRSFPFRGSLTFTGAMDMATMDSMWTYLPINETENMMPVKEVYIMNTDGSLVIGGKEYQCFGADNMYITADGDTIYSIIRRGHFMSMGQVSSLRFRGDEYAAQPIKNFLRDGYFTIATGILTALFALFSRQFLSEIKRK